MEYQIFSPFRKHRINYTIVYCSTKKEMENFVRYPSLRTQLENEYGENLIFCSSEEYIESAWNKIAPVPISADEIVKIKFEKVNIEDK